MVFLFYLGTFCSCELGDSGTGSGPVFNYDCQDRYHIDRHNGSALCHDGSLRQYAFSCDGLYNLNYSSVVAAYYNTQST